MDNESFAAGSTGLALTVGETREKVARLKEELTRAESDLRAVDARDKTELSGIDQRQQTALETLSRTVASLTERVAALEAKAAKSPPTPSTPAAPPRPIRRTVERERDYHQRLIEWAKQTGRKDPPRRGFFESAEDHDKRVRQWAGA